MLLCLTCFDWYPSGMQVEVVLLAKGDGVMGAWP